MVRDADFLGRFEDDLARKEGRFPYGRAMKLCNALWREARNLGVYPGPDPLSGLEADIRLAKVLNSCSKKSSRI
jgi:hypothetical protein